MTVLRGFLITLASGIFFGVGGAVLGYGIGRWSPDTFRAILPHASELNPIQIGWGLGLIYGGLAGLGIGLFIVLAVTWYNVRLLSERT